MCELVSPPVQPLWREPALLCKPLERHPAPAQRIKRCTRLDLSPLLKCHARTIARHRYAVTTVLAGRLQLILVAYGPEA